MSELTPGNPPQEIRDRYPDVNWQRCTVDLKLGSKKSRSRIGGRPSLPADLAWPERGGVPMAFVAQIDIEELPDDDADFFGLPERGFLYFFYDLADGAWGNEEKDFGCGRVFYAPEAGSEAADPPAGLPEGADFQAMPVRPEHSHPPAEWWALGIQGVELEDPLLDPYMEAVTEMRFAQSGGCHAQMFGDPLEIQDSMVISLYESQGNWVPEPKDDEPWILLLQLDSHKEAGMNWADAGRLYFWIREHDLMAGRFDRVWTILQSY